MISRIGCAIGQVSDMADRDELAERVRSVQAAGYESAWSYEAFGHDCFTPLAWWGGHAPGMRLGTVVAQMAARPPTGMAMAALSLNQLTGGNAVIGLGLSGPQVVEGWYGMPFERPLGWTREYVKIMRAALAGERVSHEGKTYRLPEPGGTGLGIPIRNTYRDAGKDIPIYIGAEGPKNISLAAEIADGWMPVNYSPRADDWYRERLQVGFDKRGGRPENFEVALLASVAIDDDVEAAADRLRPNIAYQVGANGAQSMNFHLNAVARLGFERECERIQELFVERRREEMVAAVPLEMVEALALVGPPEKIRKDLADWHAGVVDTLIVRGTNEDLRVFGEVFASSR